MSDTPTSTPQTTQPEKAQSADQPALAEITIKVDGQERRFKYEDAYVVACSLLEAGRPEDAAKLFYELEAFTDRGPRAFIMGAFAAAAAKDYGGCSAQLTEAFDGDELKLAGELHKAFISINVGIRKEGVATLARLVDEHKNLPTLCLLLGDILIKTENLKLARRCWALAIQRDRPGGAVAAAATRQIKRHAEQSE